MPKIRRCTCSQIGMQPVCYEFCSLFFSSAQQNIDGTSTNIPASKQRHCSYINIRSIQNSFCHLLLRLNFFSLFSVVVGYYVCTAYSTQIYEVVRFFYLTFSMLHFIVQISYPLICGTARVMNARSTKVTWQIKFVFEEVSQQTIQLNCGRLMQSPISFIILLVFPSLSHSHVRSPDLSLVHTFFFLLCCSFRCATYFSRVKLHPHCNYIEHAVTSNICCTQWAIKFQL